MTAALQGAIETLAFDPPGVRLTFVARLARDNGWTPAYAAAVEREYRRFLYLVATAGEPMTPSDAVDQAWHLHLTYTRSYWDDLCGRVVGRALHHQPTVGGTAQAAYWRDRYAATLDRYARVFGAAPPPAIWPAVEARFAPQFARIDRRQHWIVRRDHAALAALTLAAPATMAATGFAVPVIAIITVVGSVCLLVARRLRDRDARRDGNGCGGGGCGGDGGCGSGCGGCGGGD